MEKWIVTFSTQLGVNVLDGFRENCILRTDDGQTVNDHAMAVTLMCSSTRRR